MADEWAVETPEGQVRLGDLPLDVAIELEERTGEEWWRILAHPFRQAKVAKAVHDAACAHVGVEAPAVKLRDLTDLFVQVPDDLPDVYEGGLPKAEADPLTP